MIGYAAQNTIQNDRAVITSDGKKSVEKHPLWHDCPAQVYPAVAMDQRECISDRKLFIEPIRVLHLGL